MPALPCCCEDQMRCMRLLCKAKDILKTRVLSCWGSKWKITYDEQTNNFSTWVQCSSPWNPRAGRMGKVSQDPRASSTLVGEKGPPLASGQVHWESSAAHLRTLSSSQWVSQTGFDADRKEAIRRQQRQTPKTHISLPGWQVSSSCSIPRSPGGEAASIRLLRALPHHHWKAKVPCPRLKGKARLTFLTLQQMLAVCPAFHNANPDTSHSPSVRNIENTCQNSPAHAESEKSSYYSKLYIHYLSNELSAVGIQFISTLALSLLFFHFNRRWKKPFIESFWALLMQQYPWLGFEVRAVYCLQGVGCFEWEGTSSCLPGFLRLPSPWPPPPPHLLELWITGPLSNSPGSLEGGGNFGSEEGK